MNKLSAALVALLVLTGILWSGKHLLPAPASAAAPAADDSPCASTDPDTGLPLSSRVLIPDTIRECESTVVSATVRVSCGEIPLHVMLNVDRSGSMIGQAWLDAVAAARALVNTLELDRYNQTEVGLVTHGIQANVDVHLTNDGSRVTSRLAGMSPGGEDNLPQAIDRSRTELVNSRPRPGTATTPFDVMVILSDGGQTVPPSQATRSANKAKGANILVVAVCMQNQASSCPEMRKMATSAQYYFETRGTSGLTRVFSDIARQLREISLRQMDIQETLPAGTYLVPGSVSPDADIDPTGRVLSWQRRFVPSTGVTYTYEVTTSAPTTYTFANTLVTFQDSQDRNGTAMVPTKVLTVAGSCGVEIPTPSPTPTETPSATPTPTEPASPTPTPTPEPKPVYLPILGYGRCVERARPLDVALAIDASTSMAGLTSTGRTKLEAAEEGASRFIELMLPGEQAAVLSFNDTVSVHAALTSDRATLLAAVGQIVMSPNTRIDLALDGAVAELSGPTARPGANRVIVLLTDGQPTHTTPEAVRAAAQRARDAGITIFTIGLGADVDAQLLTDVAGSPGRYLFAPDGEDLNRIFGAIREKLPCD